MLEKLLSSARVGIAALCMVACAAPLQKNYHLYPEEQKREVALQDVNAILDYTGCNRPGNPEISDAVVNCLYEDKCTFIGDWHREYGPEGKAVCDITRKEIVVLGRIPFLKASRPEPFWRKDKENCLDYDGKTIGPEVYCNITTKDRQQAEDLVYAIQVYIGHEVAPQSGYAQAPEESSEKPYQHTEPFSRQQVPHEEATKRNTSNDGLGYTMLSVGIGGLAVWFLLTGEVCHNSDCQRNISEEGEVGLVAGSLALGGLGLYFIFD